MNSSQRTTYFATLDSCRKIVSSNKSCLNAFDLAYREHLCNFDMDAYVSSAGVLSTNTYRNALEQACAAALTQADHELTTQPTDQVLLSIKYGLGSPFVNGALVAMKSLSLDKHNVQLGAKPKSRPTNSSDAASLAMKSLSTSQREAINSEVIQRFSLSEPLYSVHCKILDCGICKEVYRSVNLTPCNHKSSRCLVSGYYPHAPEKLWRACLNKCHSSGQAYSPRTSDYGLPNPLSMPVSTGQEMDSTSVEGTSSSSTASVWEAPPLNPSQVAEWKTSSERARQDAFGPLPMQEEVTVTPATKLRPAAIQPARTEKTEVRRSSRKHSVQQRAVPKKFKPTPYFYGAH